MLILTTVLKGFKDGLTSPKNIVVGIDAAINTLAHKFEGFVVVKLDDSEVFSEKFGQSRLELFKTGRVTSVLSVGSYTYLLLSPIDRGTENVCYLMYKRPEEAEDASLGDNIVRNLTEEDVEDYARKLSDIDAEQRIDYRFYQKEYLDLERALEKYPTLEKVAFSVRLGFHTSFKKTGSPHLLDTLRHKMSDLKKNQERFYVPFIGIDNISPIGCVSGPVFVYDVGRKPTTRPASGGEIVMALITSSRKQEGISNIGKSAIIEEGEECYINQSFAIISPRTGVDPYFLQLSFGADYFLKQISRYRKPTSKSQDSVTLNDLKKLRIVTYDEEKMEALAVRHKQRIAIYKDIMKTMILDQKESQEISKRNFERRIEIDGVTTIESPSIREITRDDVVDVIEKLYEEPLESKATEAGDAISSELKKLLKKGKRNVEVDIDTPKK